MQITDYSVKYKMFDIVQIIYTLYKLPAFITTDQGKFHKHSVFNMPITYEMLSYRRETALQGAL